MAREIHISAGHRGAQPPDSGKISMGNRIRVRYLAQNPEFDPDKTVLQVFEGDLPEMKAVREYTETMELLDHQVMRSSSRNC